MVYLLLLYFEKFCVLTMINSTRVMMKLFLLLFFILISLGLTAQVNKNYVDSFILSKTNSDFLKLLAFVDSTAGIPFSEGVDSSIKTFTYSFKTKSGQSLYYGTKSMMSCCIQLSFLSDGEIAKDGDTPDFNKLGRLSSLYNAALIDKKKAISTAKKLIVEKGFKYCRSQLVHNFSTDTTYWQIIFKQGKIEVTERSIFIDAVTGVHFKASDSKYSNRSLYSEKLVDRSIYEGIDINSYYGIPDDTSNLDLTVIPDYFLLGTLSDYTGRFSYIYKDNQIDRYYPFEQNMVRYLTFYIKKNYKIDIDTIFDKQRHSETFNHKMSKKLNSYYGKNGNIVSDRFKTKEQVYSFLLGVYYRYGTKLSENIFCLEFYNSSKDIQVYPMLKQVGCSKIIYRCERNAVPVTDIFYFEASPQLIRYFATIDDEKGKIPNEYIDYLKGKHPGYEKEYEEYKMDRLETIKSAFEFREKY